MNTTALPERLKFRIGLDRIWGDLFDDLGVKWIGPVTPEMGAEIEGRYNMMPAFQRYREKVIEMTLHRPELQDIWREAERELDQALAALEAGK